jgi:hypothetical protein
MPPLPVLYLYQDKLSLSTLFTRTWAFLCPKDLVILLKLLLLSAVVLTVSITVTAVTAVISSGVTAHE